MRDKKNYIATEKLNEAAISNRITTIVLEAALKRAPYEYQPIPPMPFPSIPVATTGLYPLIVSKQKDTGKIYVVSAITKEVLFTTTSISEMETNLDPQKHVLIVQYAQAYQHFKSKDYISTYIKSTTSLYN